MENKVAEEKKNVSEKITGVPDKVGTAVLTGNEPVMVEGAKGMVEVGSKLPDANDSAAHAVPAKAGDGSPAIPVKPEEPKLAESTERVGKSMAKDDSSMRAPGKGVAASTVGAEVAAAV